MKTDLKLCDRDAGGDNAWNNVHLWYIQAEESNSLHLYFFLYVRKLDMVDFGRSFLLVYNSAKMRFQVFC